MLVYHTQVKKNLTNAGGVSMKTKQNHILTEALKLVPFDGWTDAMLEQATLKAGYEAGYARIAFPDGVGEVVNYYLRDLDAKMLEKLAKKDTGKLKIREKIALAVKTRLELAEPHKGVIRKTLAFYALPHHLPQSMPAVWETVDAIWHFAGDKSADFNYYTKRLLLTGVYTSTLLYWLNDTSPSHKNSWDFLNQRIDNALQIGKLKGEMTDFFCRFMPKSQVK